MDKKSFILKKRLNILKLISQTAEPAPPPKTLYRFFKEEKHADDFIKGNLRISTLGLCRGYENTEQGDLGEGSSTHHISYASGGSKDKNFVDMAARDGIHIGEGCSNITIQNNRRQTFLRDGYVLCLSLENNPKTFQSSFGRYCAKITNPQLFFNLISLKLIRDFNVTHCISNQIDYTSRVFRDMEKEPPLISMAFIKPVIPYVSQKEFRMLWIPKNNTPINFIDINCPELIGVCERIA